MDAYSRHAIKVCVAQICQIIGWTSIQSSPLEILTDILQEYITGLGRLASNYALLYGQSEPNLNHVALAFKDMGISLQELEEYVTYVESNTVLEVPKYPIPKESHLNHLKAGSREVLTRPVHIHDHLPPMHPHLEDQEDSLNKSPLTVEVPTNDSLSPLSSPKIVFKKPGEPLSSEMRRGRQISEDEIRPVREISSVMMTTSGFLSPAREGKLPEARTTQPLEQSTNSLSSEEHSSCANEESIEKCEKKKKIKSIDLPKKLDKENKVKEDQPSEQKETEEELKGKKLSNTKETSKLKAFKIGALKLGQNDPSISPSPQSLKKSKMQLSPTHNQINTTYKLNKIKNPKNDKRPISPAIRDIPESVFEDIKLPSEPDKHKLNIFKKISKVKEDCDEPKNVTPEYRDQSNPPIDTFIISSKKILNENNIENNDNEDDDMEATIDVVNTSPPIKYEYSIPPEIDKIPELPKSSEPKKKKKEKQKEKKDLETEKDRHHHSPKSKHQIEDNFVKVKLPSSSDITTLEDNQNSSFSLFRNSIPSPNLIDPWNQPPGTNQTIHILPTHDPNSSSNASPTKCQDESPTAALTTAISTSTSGTNIGLPVTTTLTNKENTLILLKKKDRKRDKKLKDKIKKKKDKKDKNKIKDKSERKKLKLEKKEKAKLKLKKEKKEKKREKEGFFSKIETSHIAEDVLNTLQPWATDSMHHKKIKVEEKDEPTNSVPKITFKLGPASPRESSEPSHRKIVIKPIIKKDEEKVDVSLPAAESFTSVFEQEDSARSAPPVLIKTSQSTPKIKVHKPGKTSHQKKHDAVEKPSPSFGFTPVLPPVLHPTVPKWEADPNKVWICPACSRPDDGSPMIACDLCDLWYHWTCVGIQEAIESDWYCVTCTSKRTDGPSEKKKKHRKKKS